MISNTTFQTTSFELVQFYHKNQVNLNNRMVHVASGKRVMHPADDAPDFFRNLRLKTDITGLNNVKSDLAYGIGLLKVAEQAGGNMWDDLNRMMELLNDYYQNNPVVQPVDQAQFSALKDKIIREISQANFDGRQLIADGAGTPLVSISLDPRDQSSTLDISFGASDTPDVSALTLGSTGYATESAALQAEIDKAGNYLAKTTAYLAIADTHFNLTNNKIRTYQTTVDNSENADQGAEMMKFTKESIAQQMTVAMMAQANMFRSSVANLVAGINR